MRVYQLLLVTLLGIASMCSSGLADDADLRKAVTLYASFDSKADADFGQGDLRLWTRADDPSEKGKKVIRLGYDNHSVSVQPGGISGGALQIRAKTADNAFVFFPAGGKLPSPMSQGGGWGGGISLWVKGDLGRIAEAGPWDPFLLTERGWNDGSVWCDFAPGKEPRDLRIGLFPVVPTGKTPPTLQEAEKIWLTVKAPAFKNGAWHHIAQTWGNFDSGKPNAWTECYLDGKLVGRIQDRDGTMQWNPEKVRFHIGSAFVGLIDEVALFNRSLTADEIFRLQQRPALLNGLK